MSLPFLKVSLDLTERALRVLCAWLCQLIYPLIAKFFQLFMTIARLDFLASDDIQPIYQRITMILSIVMVFYVTFEVVKYVIDPDQVTDKEKGAGKIAYRMIAVIVLIAFVPNIFSWAYKLQNVILENQIISKIVLGKTNVNYESFGNNFSTQMFSAFYSVNEENQTEDCDGIACGTVIDANLSSLQKYGELPYISVGINQAKEMESTIEGEKVVQPVIRFDALLAVVVGIFILYVLVLYSIDLGVRFAQMIFLQIIAPIPIMGYLIPKKDGIFEKWTKQCITTYLDLFIRLLIIFFVLAICEILGDAFESKTLLHGITASENLQKSVYIVLIMGLLLFIRKVPELIKELFPSSGKASGNFGLKASERIAPEVARTLGAAFGATRFFGGAVSRGVNTARRNKAERERTGMNRKEQREQHIKDKNELKEANRQYKASMRNRNRRFSSPQDRENAQKDFDEKRKKLEAARSKVADDKNKKYRSVALSALSGGVSGAARGAKAGFSAKKSEEIFKKAGEGYKADKEAVATREKWLDSGGGSEMDRIISGVEKRVGIVTQGELMEREIKRIDGEIKANETKISRTSVPKESLGKAEDAGKDKAEQLKAKATVGTSYGGIIAEAGDTLGSIARKGRERADRLSNEAKALTDSKIRTEQELREAQNSRATETDAEKQKNWNNIIQQKQAELNKINIDLAEKSSEANNAKSDIVNVDKAVARDEITQILQILQAGGEPDPKVFEPKVINEVKVALENVNLSKNDASVVAEAQQSLSPDLYDKYIRGYIIDFDDFDSITNALLKISNNTSAQNLANKERKQRLEASDAYAAAKADNDASGKK